MLSLFFSDAGETSTRRLRFKDHRRYPYSIPVALAVQRPCLTRQAKFLFFLTTALLVEDGYLAKRNTTVGREEGSRNPGAELRFGRSTRRGAHRRPAPTGATAEIARREVAPAWRWPAEPPRTRGRPGEEDSMAARRVRPGPLGLRRVQFWQAAPKCAVQTASPRQPARNKSPAVSSKPRLASPPPPPPPPRARSQLAIRHHQTAPVPRTEKPRRVARKGGEGRCGRVGLGEGNTTAESLASSSSTAKPPSRSLSSAAAAPTLACFPARAGRGKP
ncbi:hypothetical protein PVAP13_1NG363600 [Panicum virgatum]|uniref:Uncharacterized protein n=1 Tax=Panicum virgatum TaxID=38727 RepID=A0A8T0X0J7_PANVG|nr:hypothetical protein PVAP13_1NG363600 [Panicum virgatum]